MAVSEKLLGVEELVVTNKISKMRAAAFKMYLRTKGEKPYQTAERWETLLHEYKERNINNQ